ncbi:MAG: FIST N-terminal domain-containing protein [Candidatus Micrarchaeota archaeon]
MRKIAVGVGSSALPDSYKAGKQAAALALRKMKQKRADFVLVFASVRYELGRLLAGVREVTRQAPLIGCSSAAEITDKGPRRWSVAVMAVRSDYMKFLVGLGKDVTKHSRLAGQEAALSVASKMKVDVTLATRKSIKSKSKEKGAKPFGKYAPFTVIMLPDGLNGDGSEIINGITDVLGYGAQVIGGSAADDMRLEKCFQFFNEFVLTDSVPVALIASDLITGVGIEHGWKPKGRAAVVTHAKDNVLYELDERRALDVYKEILGIQHLTSEAEVLRMLREHPLGIPEHNEEYRIRTPLSIRKDGAIFFSAHVPHSVPVRVMDAEIGDTRNHEKLIASCVKAAKQAAAHLDKKEIAAALVFSCASRLEILGEQSARREIKEVKKVLGNAPLIGFYGYGQQATRAGVAGHHDGSMVIFVISNRLFAGDRVWSNPMWYRE